MIRPLLVLVLIAGLAAVSPSQNCAGTSVGLTPIDDLGPGLYLGAQGGLYPAGQNTRPGAHEAAGLAQAGLVVPRDASGVPAPSGAIGVVSIGMSNTSQEWSEFIPISNADPNRAGEVVVVNGAQGGQHAGIISNPAAQFWNIVDQRLTQAGLTPAQVQVVWLKEAVPGPTDGFPTHAEDLRDLLRAIVQIIHDRYPNCRLCYLASRIYAGYATSTLNPEPWAYESAFSVKWLIEEQIAGDPALAFDPSAGPVQAPWLAWGPYMWADGLTPRSDGLIWECTDFSPDGTHPATPGRIKVAAALDAFFRSDTTTSTWYVGTGNPGGAAAVVPYGQGCVGTNGVPNIVTNGLPALGNPNFAIGVNSARPAAFATLFVSLGAAQIPVGGCDVLVDPALLVAPTAAAVIGGTTNGGGALPIFTPISSDPIFDGLVLYCQWFVLDPQGAGFPQFGGAALTRGAALHFGLP